MRMLFRSNSFGSRLLAGSAQFYLSFIGFLMVLLAFSLLHSFRLTTQLERVHWQLALSQMLRATIPSGPMQGEDARQMEQRVSDPDAQLKLIREHLEKLIRAQSPDAFPAASCPKLDVEESQAASMPLVRAAVGIFLLVTGGGIFYLWKNVDRLKDIVPQMIIKYTGEDETSRPLSHILAYKSDRWFSTNKHAKVLALLFFTLLLVVVGSLGLFAVSDVSLYEALWGSLAGVGVDWTFSQDLNPKAGMYSIIGRLVSMMISLGGLLITALLLGIVSEIISDKVDEMKKGTSDVLETSHTLILGWSDETIPILRQICLANESIGGAAIVILAEREKEEMEADISKNSIQLKGSEIICRYGNPLLNHDLDKVSVHSARSIIVLANQQSPDQSDARVLRIILSLVAFHEEGGLQGYVVAELCDMDNEPLVKLVGGDLVQTVVSHDIIGRLMLQCAMQPGLAAVYDEIMGFEGCEFYFQHWTELDGKKFNEALLSFPDAVPIGVKEGCTGNIKMNLDDDYILKEDDELLVVAEDEDTYRPEAPLQIKAGMCPSESPPRETEKILFLGWRRDMDDMIVVLDQFVTKGSELWLYNEVPIKQREQMLIQGGLNPDTDLKNLLLRYKEEDLEGELITRKKLEALNPASFSSILVLADESANGDDIADADSRNLATLLLLRDIMRPPEHSQMALFSSRVSIDHLRALSMEHSETVIVSEILDARTRHLIKQLNISEFVMSNEIVSMALSMVAESADVNHVLQELFSEEGAEFYLRPAEKYIRPDEQLSFFELMARCRQRKEIAIGFKRRRERDTIINPPNKSESNLDLRSIDSIIVLAN